MRVGSIVVGSLERLRRADDRLGEAIRRRQSAAGARAARLATHAGSWVTQAAVPAIAIAAAARGGDRRRVAYAVVSMLGTSATFHAVKHFVQRDRPHPDWHLVRTSDSSFPSGHAATSAAAARVLAETTGWPKPLLASVAAVVGATRVYLGVHHPSDVVGGFVIGWGWASLTARALRAGEGTGATAGPAAVRGDGDTPGPLGYTEAEWAVIAAAKASDAGHPVTGM